MSDDTIASKAERDAQRDHELAVIKAQKKSEWAITARIVLVWTVVLAAVCYLASIGAI